MAEKKTTSKKTSEVKETKKTTKPAAKKTTAKKITKTTTKPIKEVVESKKEKELKEVKVEKEVARIDEVKEQNIFLKFLKEIWIYLVIIVVLLLLKVYVVSPIKVNGNSMVDTLHDQDIMILNKIAYKFEDVKRFDLVVIKGSEEDLIKRVIGLPGEHIAYKDNKLYVDGKLVEENFNHNAIDDYDIDELESHTVPEDTYFVLGDNRVGSLDSRVLGFIHKDIILGRAKFIVYPFNRFGNVN